ncbi:unknown [Lactobacillus phage Lb338-1]|jgi:hypothetical protein|uniref:Uncharacterized protein n=1 Tax=Lactobacillus phage Lb338-1 TaxID=2892342 RepID=C1KFG5_9CAUD|nr:hypothetical protein lb338_phage_55 [Lactobacillus phage Lb338-1]ACO36976.1 unknown [Lactobacillus phage Lb338-1]QNO01192.1 hypothetical protein [Lactobacillus phage Lbab1]
MENKKNYGMLQYLEYQGRESEKCFRRICSWKYDSGSNTISLSDLKGSIIGDPYQLRKPFINPEDVYGVATHILNSSRDKGTDHVVVSFVG